MRVVRAELGTSAGMIGAALVALDAADSRTGLMPLAVCATPIGNLQDVTLRVLDELAEADLVLCEDTRRTRILLDRHGVSARLLSYHEHNEAARTAEVLPQLEAGARVALVSDAGLPGVSDPGARLVAAALEAGVPVTVLPGASAVETALVAAASRPSATSSSATCRAARRRSARSGTSFAAGPGRRSRSSRRGGCPDAGVPRARLAGPPRRGLPRADQAVRGGRARLGGGGRRTLLRAAERRDHPRSRPCRPVVGRGARSARSRRSTSWSRPASRDGRRPTSSPGSPG